MITVVELEPGRWVVTRTPTWLGRLFGRQAVQAVVARCGCESCPPSCRGLMYESTLCHVMDDRYEGWVWRAVELQPVNPFGAQALPPMRLLPEAS